MNEKPWPLAGYAPGNYTRKCIDCDKQFDGDKRAIQCLECAAISVKSRAPSPSPAPGVVRNALAAKAEASGLLSVEDIDEVFAKLRIDPTKSNPVEAALRYARVSILTGTGTVAAISKIDAALASLAQGGDGGAE